MSRTIFVLAFIFMLSSQAVFAQKMDVITKKSSIEWLGKKIGGQHEGNIQLKSGYLEMDGDRIAAGNFVVDMTTIVNNDIENETYKKKLVGHLKSDDFFGVESHPTAMFVVKKSTKFSDGKAKLTGDITIKGITNPITFDVEKKDNGYFARIEIDRSKFDVRYGSKSFFDNLGDKVIYDIFTLDVNLAVN